MNPPNTNEFTPFTDNDWSAFAGATKFASGMQPLTSDIYLTMEDPDGCLCETYHAVVIIDQPDKLDRPGDWPSKTEFGYHRSSPTNGELYHVTIHFEDETISKELDGAVFTYTCDASWFTPLQFKTKMELLFWRMADSVDHDDNDRLIVTSASLRHHGFQFSH